MKIMNALQTYLSEATNNNTSIIELYKEEIDFVKRHQLISEEGLLSLTNNDSRFNSAYIERSNKETEELISVMDENFLNEKISYLKQNIGEFIYIESPWFEQLGVESLCIEVDDVFGTYEVMLGLLLQKKYQEKIKANLNEQLQKDRKYSLLFNQQDGLWELNLALNGLQEFHDDLELKEVCKLIYLFLFRLVKEIEEKK